MLLQADWEMCQEELYLKISNFVFHNKGKKKEILDIGP